MSWAKGQSGNPNGRPPTEKAVATALRRLLRTTEPDSGKTYRTLVVGALVDAALAGNVEAIKTIFERVDGKVPNPVEITGAVEVRSDDVRDRLAGRLDELAERRRAKDAAS